MLSADERLPVLPHRGAFAQSDVPAVARAYNYPLHLRRVPSTTAVAPLLTSAAHAGPFALKGDRNVVLDTVKRGEDDHFSASAAQQTIVLRLYEAYGGAGKVKVEARLPEGKKVVKAEVVDVRCRSHGVFAITSTDSARAHSCSSDASRTCPSRSPRPTRSAEPRTRSTSRVCGPSRFSPCA